jgi:hypothetical protein
MSVGTVPKQHVRKSHVDDCLLTQATAAANVTMRADGRGLPRGSGNVPMVMADEARCLYCLGCAQPDIPCRRSEALSGFDEVLDGAHAGPAVEREGDVDVQHIAQCGPAAAETQAQADVAQQSL